MGPRQSAAALPGAPLAEDPRRARVGGIKKLGALPAGSALRPDACCRESIFVQKYHQIYPKSLIPGSFPVKLNVKRDANCAVWERFLGGLAELSGRNFPPPTNFARI